MSNAIGQTSFASVIRAAVRKDMAEACLVDAIRDAAHKYARQGGAKPLLDSLVTDVTTSANGKKRTPADGTVSACVLAALLRILKDGPLSGARDTKAENREELAVSFAETVAQEFYSAVVDGQSARKAKAEKAKADKKATAEAIAETASNSDTAETPSEAKAEETPAEDYKALYFAALAEIEALKAVNASQAEKLAKRPAKKAA
jgi:hypothetical protein